MIFPLRCPLSIAGEQLKTENKISAFKCLPHPACKTQFVPVPGICSLPYSDGVKMYLSLPQKRHRAG